MRALLVILALTLTNATLPEDLLGMRFLDADFTPTPPTPVAGQSNSVIDLSHWQGRNLDFQSAADNGLQAVFAKATQGSGYTDPNYSYYKQQAQNAGLHFGSYHFGDGSNPITQAKNFLSAVGNPKGQVLALDFEKNPNGSSMTIPQAVQFVNYVKQQTGQTPVIYGGSYLRQQIGSGNSTLNSLPLWVSTYRSKPVLPGGWNNYSLWQYTDGVSGPDPRTTEGLGQATDKSVYNGSASDLNHFWNEYGQPVTSGKTPA